MTANSLPKAIATLAACLAIHALPAHAAPGDLDSTFGAGGKVTAVLGAQGGLGCAGLVQPDGRIVVAGTAEQGMTYDFALIRYLPDGTWDPSFGFGGRMNTRVAGKNTRAWSLARQNDGKLLVAGRADTGTDRFDFALARYHTNGAVDTTFGTSGLATLSLGGANGEVYSVALQSDGKIVAVGAYRINAQDRMVLARFLADGTLDISFGDSGQVIPYIGGVWDSGNSVAIQPDGKIVVGGTLSQTNVQESFALVRFHPHGVLDDSFGSGGKVVTRIGGGTYSGGQSVVLQDDGKIVLAGYTWGEALDMALARYHPNGTLDTSFGGGGTVVTGFGSSTTELAYGAALQSDGRILVTGTSEVDGTNCLTVVRYLPNGALDTSFGTGGRVTSDFGNNAPYYVSPGRSVVVQSDGQIIATGGTYGDRVNVLAVARFVGTTEPEIAVEYPAGVNLTHGSANMDFGGVATGGGVATRTFTVRNPSTASLTGLAVSRDGTNAEDFTVGRPADSVLGPGGSTTFTVTFAPTTPGLRRAAIHIASNDADENPFDITLAGTGVGQVQPGALDTTFGAGGKVTTTIAGPNSRASGLAVQSDGKLLVAGSAFNGNNYDFALVRYNANGSPDSGFGNQGMVTTPLGSSQDYASSVAVQSDGKIIVAGDADNGNDSDFALVRYLAGGTLDTGFGSGGKLMTALAGNSSDVGKSVAVQPDGKIVVAGYADNGNVTYDFAVVRYLPDGTLDSAFGSGGKVLTPIGSADDDYGASVVLQSDGKIVVTGYSVNDSGNNDFALVRYLSNGTLDSTLGSGGKVITPVGLYGDIGQSAVVQSDGKIVVAGYSGHSSGDGDFALVRYLPNGSLDTTFGSGGKVTTDIGDGFDDSGHSVALQSDGKIVVAGNTYNGANYDMALARYLANGTLDATFGFGGKMSVPVGVSDDLGWSVAVQSDGRIVVAGDTRHGGDYDFALVRILGTTTPEIVLEQPAGNNLTDGSASIDFGSLATNGGPATRTFTVRNASTAGLTVQAVTQDGANAADFTVGVLGNPHLTWGESTTFVVTFLPGAAGLRTAAIHIPSNDADENPFDITLTGTGLAAPTIATENPLPSGMVGAAYDLTFAASGGLAPYTWSFVSGGVSAGLTLSSAGLISGTPSLATTTNFMVRVTDALGFVATKAFSLTIIPPLHPGDLDPSFGTNGKVTLALGSDDDYGYSAAVQSDGKIVVGGYSMVGNYEKFAVARFLTDGTLDTSFGNGGKVTTAISPYSDYGKSLALQSDGKILVAGEYPSPGYPSLALVRYQANGTLDTTFGSGGKVTSTFGFSFFGKTVMIQSDGKIVTAGQTGTGCADYGAAGYLPGGILDTNFGNGGRVTTDFGAGSCDYAQGAALQTDDKLLIVGYAPGSSGDDFGLVRYLANGALDPTFGNGGKVSTPFTTGRDGGRSVVVQSDGKIVAVGDVGGDFALVRYFSDGSLDTDFGTAGKVTTKIGIFDDVPQGVVVQSDGKIVVGGYSGNGANGYDFSLARYDINGTLDASFGAGGKVMTAIGSGNDHGRSVVLQSDGKIVMAGDAYNGSNYDFAVVRYIGSLGPEISVEQPAGTALVVGHASIEFASAALGGIPVVRTITVRNVGTASLTGLALSQDGDNSSDFTVGDLGTTTLAPGARINFTITFAPGALGLRTAKIRISNNDDDEDPFDINLTGAGGSYTPLQAWRLAHFGSPDDSGEGANANDFDQDGIINLWEYAFGGDPKTPDVTVLRPRASLAGDGGLVISFWCDARCTDLTYTVQASRNLEPGSWIDVARSYGGGSVSPVWQLGIGLLCATGDPSIGLRTARVSVDGPYFLEGPRFLRVMVSE